MLNQTEHDDTFQKIVNPKHTLEGGAATQNIDGDTTNENVEPCALCKGSSNSGKAKRPANQRAKVTVQRRANTKQKVVSLSFDRAIELKAHGEEIVVGQDAFTFRNTTAATPEDEKMLMKAISSTDPAETKRNDKINEQGNDGARGSERETHNQRIEKEVVLSQADDVFSFNEEDENTSDSPTKEEKQSTAPPPIRLRQAWASPSQVRQQKSSPVRESKATNTDTKRDKSKPLQKKPTELSPNAKNLDFQTGCSTNSEDPSDQTEKQSDPIKDGHVSQLTGDATTTAVQGKKKKKIRIDVKLPQADDCAASEKPRPQLQFKSRQQTLAQTRADTKTGPISDHGAEKANVNKNFGATKNHGMGDAEIGPEKGNKQTKDKGDTNSGNTNVPKNDDKGGSTKVKTKKAKKPGGSLFSWSPFRRKPFLKQNPYEGHAGEKKDKGSMKKTSMTDVMYMQGRVAIPQTLTEMFAASHPEKAEVAHQNKPGPKCAKQDKH